VSDLGEDAYPNRNTREYSACNCCVELLLANGSETVHNGDLINRENDYSTNTQQLNELTRTCRNRRVGLCKIEVCGAFAVPLSRCRPSSTSNILVEHVFRSNRTPGEDVVSLSHLWYYPREPAGASGRSISGLTLGTLKCAPPLKAVPCHIELLSSYPRSMGALVDDTAYNHVPCGTAVCLLCRICSRPVNNQAACKRLINLQSSRRFH
jgi:hypothetical protein